MKNMPQLQFLNGLAVERDDEEQDDDEEFYKDDEAVIVLAESPEKVGKGEEYEFQGPQRAPSRRAGSSAKRAASGKED